MVNSPDAELVLICWLPRGAMDLNEGPARFLIANKVGSLVEPWI